MSSRIEQLIDEIEDYIESCKPKFMSSTEIIVNKDEIDELLRELRMKTPDEIKRYQKIISNKEAILNDAKAKAEALAFCARRSHRRFSPRAKAWHKRRLPSPCSCARHLRHHCGS